MKRYGTHCHKYRKLYFILWYYTHMKSGVVWTKNLTEEFIELAMLSDDEAYLMRSRVKGTTVPAQAMYLSCSESTVHRMISKIKKKYDAVQKEHPNEFPIRRTSKKEEWMDSH